MPSVLSRLRTSLRRPARATAGPAASAEACSWDAMKAVYEKQAERGDPDAIRGLELIEQDRWPSSGQPRARER